MVGEILAAAQGATIAANNEAELTKAADVVRTRGQTLAAGTDGSALAALDSLIPGEDRYKGSVYRPQEED